MLCLKMACLSVGSSERSGSGVFCHCIQKAVAPTASHLLHCLLTKEKMMAFHAQQAVLHACPMHIYTEKGAVLLAVQHNLAVADRLYVPLACHPLHAFSANETAAVYVTCCVAPPSIVLWPGSHAASASCTLCTLPARTERAATTLGAATWDSQ